MRKIIADQKIIARDQNKVFVEKADSRKLSPADAEEKYGLAQGKANAYVEFDIESQLLHWQKNVELKYRRMVHQRRRKLGKPQRRRVLQHLMDTPMEAKVPASGPEMIEISKRDLIEAWSVLERLVVSLRKIGSVYSIPEGQTEQTSEQRQQMLEALHNYFTPELWRELAHARRVLAEYLPSDEAEEISDALRFWQPEQR